VNPIGPRQGTVWNMARVSSSSGRVQSVTMPVSRAYLYQAATVNGGRTVGLARARDAGDLAAQLRQKRLVPLRSWVVPGLGGESGPGKVSLKDQAELHGQLAQLLTRGVPLVEALEVAQTSVTPAMRSRVTKIRELVSGGSSFADAIAAVGGFDSVSISVYRAAERTGDLGGAAKQLSTTCRRQLAVRGKAMTLMLYPVIVLSISVIVSVGMMTVVVPGIIESMRESVSSMPWFTELVYGVGVFMRDNWMVLAGLLMVLCGAAVVFRGALARGVGVLMTRLPLLRDVYMAQECARLFTVMSAMTRTGVVLADALGVAETAVSHVQLRTQVAKLRARLVEGGVLRVLIDQVTALPLGTRRLLIAAERSGDMQAAFETLAGDMADEVDTRSARLLAVLEPLLIFIMFLMIGSLVLSIMVPMITLSGRVQS